MIAEAMGVLFSVIESVLSSWLFLTCVGGGSPGSTWGGPNLEKFGGRCDDDI